MKIENIIYPLIHEIKYKSILFLSSAIILLSCSGNKEGNRQESNIIIEDTEETSPEINLETFGYLDEVMGCGCYLATDSLQFRQQNFVYAEKYGLPDKKDFGFIKLDNQLIRLEVLSVDNNSEESLRNVRLANDQVEVWLKLKLNESDDPEVLPTKGEIQIHLPDRLPIVQSVTGICGC